MIRTQIQLSEKQAAAIKRLAASRSISMAELIRQAVEGLIGEERRPEREELRQRAIEAAGRFHVDVDDLATDHDEHLADAFAERS